MDCHVSASAPGKLILFGEHAVVHGEPAIATALSLRTWCDVTLPPAADPAPVVTLELASVAATPLRFSWPAASLASLVPQPWQGAAAHIRADHQLPALDSATLDALGAAADAAVGDAAPEAHRRGLMAFALLYAASGLSQRPRGMALRVHSTLPVGAGLGSSAAFSAALCGALWRVANLAACAGEEEDAAALPCCSRSPGALVPCSLCKEALNRWTYQSERVLHGNPSGIDNSIAIYGGALSFVRGAASGSGITHVPRMPELPLVLTDTRVPRSTQRLVAGVGERLQRHPEAMKLVLAAVGAISRRSLAAFAEATPTPEATAHLMCTLEELIDMNQGLLDCMGVGHEAIGRVVRAAAALGYHTKLTGAGGGGCVMTLVPDAHNKTQLLAAIADMGMRGFETSVGGVGLTVQVGSQPI